MSRKATTGPNRFAMCSTRSTSVPGSRLAGPIEEAGLGRALTPPSAAATGGMLAA